MYNIKFAVLAILCVQVSGIKFIYTVVQLLLPSSRTFHHPTLKLCTNETIAPHCPLICVCVCIHIYVYIYIFLKILFNQVFWGG